MDHFTGCLNKEDFSSWFIQFGGIKLVNEIWLHISITPCTFCCHLKLWTLISLELGRLLSYQLLLLQLTVIIYEAVSSLWFDLFCREWGSCGWQAGHTVLGCAETSDRPGTQAESYLLSCFQASKVQRIKFMEFFLNGVTPRVNLARGGGYKATRNNTEGGNESN